MYPLRAMILYGSSVLLSAFLLFLVQPMMGKFILPWFGGSPAVWTTCMLFFQVLLLGGYSYAHLIATRLSGRKQALLHVYMLATTLFLLPVTPSAAWKPGGNAFPTTRILGLLTASVGGCYFMLSSTGPLLQSWFSRAQRSSSPYKLYSLSNIGSMLAIGFYPLLIEPRWGLAMQARLWSWGYVVFVLMSGACALPVFRLRGELPEQSQSGEETRAEAAVIEVPRVERIIWLALAATASVMLLATTNQMCQDVAVIPLLWMVPLGLYLLSFILCFHSDKTYSRPLFGFALVVVAVQACVVLFQGILVSLHWQIASYCATLFVCCMVCHGELARRKPHSDRLTTFYLMVAGGGALGGAFVTLVAPHIFKGFWEFHLGLAGTALLFLFLLFRDRGSRLHHGKPLWAWTPIYAAFVALLVTLSLQIRETLQDNVDMRRNFFGVLRIQDSGADNPQKHRLVLMHGRIEHGYQFTAIDKRYWPTSYFGPSSGVGVAIRFHPNRSATPGSRNLRIGVVGLGTGTLATYGEEGDYFRFYEINPQVLQLSDRYFSYRADSAAKIDVVLGDARVSMERERAQSDSQHFDVLAVDAFSSDAIPVHLLTRECCATYWYHLKRDGILAVHVSSRYFNLSPVVRALADLDQEQGMRSLLVADDGSETQETDATRWILVTSNTSFLETKEVQDSVTPWKDSDPAPLLFTDDYSNLFRLLRR
ncbi:MAG TPA: fused MFS/spermidine synthase [Acidobacteriota bacterium]|nr:fused MFS/spermidine synthase [Acidobacteriota bacterium]